MRSKNTEKREGNLLLLKRISAGIIASVIILTGFFIYNRNILPVEFLLYETLPYYNYNNGGVISDLFKFTPEVETSAYAGVTFPDDRVGEASGEDAIAVSVAGESPEDDINYYIMPEMVTDSDDVVNTFVADEDYYRQNALKEANDSVLQIESGYNPLVPDQLDLLSAENVIYQPETGSYDEGTHDTTVIAPFTEGWQEDIAFLRKNFYSVEKETEMTEADFNGKLFTEMSMRLSNSGSQQPTVLIFHTHMYEDYIDSDHDNIYDGVYGFGEKLARILRDKYGIIALHHDGRYDIVDGLVSISGAYERMEPDIRRILDENPSIEVAVDIHRDGVSDSIKLETTVNGDTTAPIMFVNGLSKIYSNGILKNLTSFPNENQTANLAFSFQTQLAANELYPGLARRIYLKPYRYSLHMLPKSLLVEIGAQTNTKAEAFRAAEPLADILAKVLLGK